MSDWSDSYKVAEGDLYSPHERQYAKDNKSKSIKEVKKALNAKTNFVTRGGDKTRVTRRPMTDVERQTICVLKGRGLTHEEIGEKLHRPATSIQSVLLQAEKLAKAAGLNFDWRADLLEKSVTKLREALTSNQDVYKGGNLALGTLKGLGEFENEGATVNLAALINGVPEHLRSRYISSEPQPQIEAPTSVLEATVTEVIPTELISK